MLLMVHAVAIHTIKVPFQSIQVSGPEPAELSQPGIHLLKRFGFQPVEASLRVHRGLDETGVAQHSQVLGHGWLRHMELTLDLSHRLLGRDQEAQYRAAVRLRNDLEHRFHSLNILRIAYTCQGIYKIKMAQLPQSFRLRLRCDHPSADALDTAFCDGQHAVLHSGVRSGGNCASKFGSVVASLG